MNDNVTEVLREVAWRVEREGTHAREREAPRPRPTTAERETFFARIAAEIKRAEAT